MIDDARRKRPDVNQGVTVHRDGDAIVVSIPVRLHRRNGKQMVLAHGNREDDDVERESNGTLISAIAKAYRWQGQLEAGEFGSLEDLAAANGVDRSYVGRHLRLTSLAPEIVERILDGYEPHGISLAKLRNEFSVVWAEQQWNERAE